MAIISFDYNFIFIKTRKTAGTSIEVDLSQHLGETAIVTPILPLMPGHNARNYKSSNGTNLYFNHMSAVQIREQLGADKFSSMYKFCVEREPIAKSISHYHMHQNSKLHNKDGQIISWAEYCIRNNFPVDYNKYSDTVNGKSVSLVDTILPYETLNLELPKLLEKLGIPKFKLNTRAKSEYSKNTLIQKHEVTNDQHMQIYKAFELSNSINGLY